MTAIKAFLKTILYTPLLNVLIFFVWLMPNDNVGWAIIILTILIRILLLPSSAKAIRAQQEVQSLQPEIEKLKEQYKNDTKTQSEKLMALYRQKKVNPLGSCLPLLIQFPILIVLYYVFRDGLDKSHFDLLYSFVPRPDNINTYFFGINLSQPSLYLAILAGLTQFLQSKLMMPKMAQPKPNGKSDILQKTLSGQFTYIMPVFTAIIAMRLPSALALYWSVTAIATALQQLYLNNKLKKEPQGVSVVVRREHEEES